MLIAGYCFRDEEMRSSISINKECYGVCEASGFEGELADLELFYDFFDEALSLFTSVDNGLPLIKVIQDDWHLFVSDGVGEIILTKICSDLRLSLTARSLVTYTDVVLKKIAVWDELKVSVMNQRRFFSTYEKLDRYAFLIPEATLNKRTTLFRARLLPKDRKSLKKSELGCPPPNLSTAGRANPPGIPYLYLCNDEETTYYEVRAVQLDKLCIGRFIVQKDLKIVDFNSEVSLYWAYDDGNDLAEVVAGKKIISAIQKDMSRPMRRYDSELEYIPTQMICEYCKLKGADGISFDSTLHRGGKNYVLFNDKNAKCTKVFYRDVAEISIKV